MLTWSLIIGPEHGREGRGKSGPTGDRREALRTDCYHPELGNKRAWRKETKFSVEQFEFKENYHSKLHKLMTHIPSPGI